MRQHTFVEPSLDGRHVIRLCKIVMAGDSIEAMKRDFEAKGCTVEARQHSYLNLFDVVLPAGTVQHRSVQYGRYPVSIFVLEDGTLLTILNATDETPFRTLVVATVNLVESIIVEQDRPFALRDALRRYKMAV